MEGTVITSTGNWYEVGVDNQEVYACKVKGNFRLKGLKSTNPVAVGDRVEFEYDPRITTGAPGVKGGWITRIYERKNCIIRKSVNLSKQTHIIAANLDIAFLVIGLSQPKTPQGFIDRFLVTCQAYHVPACIIINKSDLFDPELEAEAASIKEIYTPLGYDVLCTSTITGLGIEDLKSRMKGKTSLFSGNSGVGKSALVSCLEPGLNIRIGEISATHLKGKHTTTHARMYPLSFGGYIVDTPGIKEFGMVQFQKDELSLYFPEMHRLISKCKFNNCTHEHEPGCAVKEAVQRGEISEIRYNSYLHILHGEEVPLPGLLENKQEKK